METKLISITRSKTNSSDPHTKSTSFSVRTRNQVNFDPTLKTKSTSICEFHQEIFGPKIKPKSILTPAQKTSQVLSRRYKQVISYRNKKNKSMPIHHIEVKSFFDNPHNNHINFILHWNQGKFDHPHRDRANFDHP